jgi:hypothetical protein
MTQTTVSRAEGSGDIRLATLVEIARALDLEPTLIPRRWIPAFQALFGDDTDASARVGPNRLLTWDGTERYTEADDDPIAPSSVASADAAVSKHPTRRRLPRARRITTAEKRP